MQSEALSGRFKALVHEGKRVEATSPNNNIEEVPGYYDAQRFARAQKLFKKYYAATSMSSYIGLTQLLQIQCILNTLLKTGKSRTIVCLYERYTSTVKHILKLYETDFINKDSEGWKTLELVRAMHQRAYKLMNCDQTALRPAHDGVWVNQYDMALTQFAFIGLFLLHPAKCGAHYATRQELSDIVYYWRLISYYFGIEERFNLFVYHDDLDKQKQLLNIVLEHQNELLQRRNETGSRMAQGLALAFEELLVEGNFKIFDHHWRPILSLSGLPQPEAYALNDLKKLIVFHMAMKILVKSDRVLMPYLTSIYRKRFDKFVSRGDKIKKKLDKKYTDIAYEL